MSPNPFALHHPDRIYLDHNATTPLAQGLGDELVVWCSRWGNPSSIHWDGRGPKTLLREARQNVAALVGSDPLEIIFTSGGSEANNLAIKGVFDSRRLNDFSGQRLSDRPRFLMSAVEHPSVRKTMEYIARQGADVHVIPVDRDGQIDLMAYDELLNEQTSLVSVMYANNETGNIFPVKKMAKMAHEVGALFHCDGVQALGKAVVDVKKWEVDLASFSGHKFYGLKGGGFLYASKGVHLESLIHGGGQERGRRAGTENVLSIASMGWMARFKSEVEQRAGETKDLRDHLESRITKEITGTSVTGREGKRLPNTSCVLIPGIDGETLLMNLDMKGFAVSTGAACSAGNPEPSPVLLAMGLSREEAQSTLRVSLGWGTTCEDINQFVDALKETVDRLRSLHAEGAE
ncbi:MAG: cysteine desulfurase [Bdellovibrionaceae bacterium]|nr:cysteine desulfurase [Bdellovibrionales bacterium]MCB9083915.1 cysteine desulfurase [Pseudobdellovibrionaceae bacterium]